jgi:hypothetical protein
MDTAVSDGKAAPRARTGSGPGAEDWALVYTGLPKEGIVLALKVPSSQKPVLKLVDLSDGLPEVPGHSFSPRPDYLIRPPLARFDSSTLVSKTLSFESQL